MTTNLTFKMGFEPAPAELTEALGDALDTSFTPHKPHALLCQPSARQNVGIRHFSVLSLTYPYCSKTTDITNQPKNTGQPLSWAAFLLGDANGFLRKIEVHSLNAWNYYFMPNTALMIGADDLCQKHSRSSFERAQKNIRILCIGNSAHSWFKARKEAQALLQNLLQPEDGECPSFSFEK
jgi:hypothetical protein